MKRISAAGIDFDMVGCEKPACAPPASRSLLDGYIWIGVWLCLSVSVILVNKQVLFYANFHYPCALAVWHMLVAAVTSRILIYALGLRDPIAEHQSIRLYGQIAATGLLFGATLMTGNAALLYIPVTTTQMLKVSAATTPATLQGLFLGTAQLLPSPPSSREL